MTNVMSRAWEIAKAGQAKFGGSVSEYIAVAIKMAWAEAKAPQGKEWTLEVNARRGKTWLARITGKDDRWGLARDFIDEAVDNGDEKTWYLQDGIYEYCQCGNRKFVEIYNGRVFWPSKKEVLAEVA